MENKKTTREIANDQIINMSYQIFSTLMKNTDDALQAHERAALQMPGIDYENPSDVRYNREKYALEKVLLCMYNHEPVLTQKMLSLYITFANPSDRPNYFEEICETFQKKDLETQKMIPDYQRIAFEYGTTVDNVKSNILYRKFIKTYQLDQNQSKTKRNSKTR